ncbi:hopanoid-associated phosphorylase [Methylorubrum zatmanii]|nr:hopanoid-associated phosphorylase [Methylorubrum zatmanii]MCP1554075.1 hopanoid-associated phosphorylase [Methylorubrum extorquens]MCP1579614.1 hopanoid-associated phosphorylase [Methylorubrum extorquens]
MIQHPVASGAVMGGAVLAVAGLAREARIAAGPGVETIQAGGNPERLRAALDRRSPGDLRAVVSFGIAGGLDPALRPGDIVVGTHLDADQRFPADPELARRLSERLTGSPRVVAGGLVGSAVAVMTVADKAALHARTGALAVDMESHVAAAYAARHALPFAAVRVVCDPAGRALPAFAASALTPEGEPDIRAVLGALLRGQARIGELIRLGRDSSAAFAALARCRARLGPGLGLL